MNDPLRTRAIDEDYREHVARVADSGLETINEVHLWTREELEDRYEALVQTLDHIGSIADDNAQYSAACETIFELTTAVRS